MRGKADPQGNGVSAFTSPGEELGLQAKQSPDTSVSGQEENVDHGSFLKACSEIFTSHIEMNPKEINFNHYGFIFPQNFSFYLSTGQQQFWNQGFFVTH